MASGPHQPSKVPSRISHSPTNPFVPHDLLNIDIEVPWPSERLEPAVAVLAGVVCGIYKPLVTLDAHLNNTHINFIISSRRPFDMKTHGWVHVELPAPSPTP